VHLPNRGLFKDAPTCGIFVKKFVGRIVEEVTTGMMEEKCPALAKYLFVNNDNSNNKNNNSHKNKVVIEESEKENTNININKDQDQDQYRNPCQSMTCFVDIGVYTRNRLFYLLNLAKFGKPLSAGFRIASANQFSFPDGFNNELFFNPDTDTNNDMNTGTAHKTSDGYEVDVS